MTERTVYRTIDKIGDPTLRSVARGFARFVLENWLYVLAAVLLWRFPYIVADLSGSEVMPRRPSGDSVFWQSVMAQALLIACLAMSYNMLFGFSGVISFGHALFFGIGGYATFVMMTQYEPGSHTEILVGFLVLMLGVGLFTKMNVRHLVLFVIAGVALILLLLPGSGALSIYQAIGVAVLVSIGLSLVSGMVTLRLRGVYFTMFTLALAEMVWVLAKSGTLRNVTGAEDGLPFRDLVPEVLNPTPTFTGNRLDMYYITVVFFAVVFLAIRRYINSPVGRVMVSIRENEQRAKTIGYNVFYYKLLTMVFAGVIATLAGVLFVLWGSAKRVDPGLLSLKYTVDPLLMTLIGGVGTLTGPVVAALGLELGRTYLREETFTLGTKLFGLLTLWQAVWMAGFALFFYAFRRRLLRFSQGVLRRAGQAPQHAKHGVARTSGAAIGLAVGMVAVVLVIVALVAHQVYLEAELADNVYEVSDLWDLFLGLVFIVVVMLLPNGVVGTWNRWRIGRQVRRMERAMALKSAAAPEPAPPLAREVEQPSESV